MATLELINLHCHRKRDLTGKDEPRIKVDGVVVWNGVMNKGDDLSLRPTSVGFEGDCQVILDEMHNQNPKQIGAAVTIRESGNPASLHFKTSGAWYEMTFEVAVSPPATTSARRSI